MSLTIFIGDESRFIILIVPPHWNNVRFIFRFSRVRHFLNRSIFVGQCLLFVILYNLCPLPFTTSFPIVLFRDADQATQAQTTENCEQEQWPDFHSDFTQTVAIRQKSQD